MAFDSDVALIGTGLAPLVAASRLLAEGKNVLLINPDWDFFREDSELPFDPLSPLNPGSSGVEQLKNCLRKRALAELRPGFPGAIELWPPTASGGSEEGYHDRLAPHVRTRIRLMLDSAHGGISSWSDLEEMYVHASDAGLNPSFIESELAYKRFPGTSLRKLGGEGLRGLLFPKMCDVDVARYRNGLLEFIREKLGRDGVICNASQIDFIPEGVRFRSGRLSHTARLSEGAFVFWTPRLTQWVFAQSKKAEVTPVQFSGVRMWEEWSLASRESLSPEVLGTFEDMIVWAEVEGAPDSPVGPLNRLAVLRPAAGGNWASAESFSALTRLCDGFLQWDHFSVRAMRPRMILDWPKDSPDGFWLRQGPLPVWVCCGCDGSVVDVAARARRSYDRLGVAEPEGES